MKTKAVIFLIMLFSVAKAQNNEWFVYNQSNSGLPDNSVKAIDFDAERVWVGTIQGLGVIKNNQWEVYNSSNSELDNDYIRCISIDNTGSKWIGTLNGAVSIDNSPSERGWTVYNSSNSGLPIDNITTVAVDTNNKKWFGTWGGGVAKFDENGWVIYDMYNSGLPVNGIYDLEVDDNNNIWVATHGGGLAKYDGLDWHVYNTSNSNLPSNIIYSLDFDWQSNIWLGTELGLVKFDGVDQWRFFNSYNTGWNFTSVMCVKVDEINQKVYFGTYYGLGIYAADAFTFKKTTNSGISNNWVSVINIDSIGNKWIGTLGGGISIYNENGVNVSVENPVIPDRVFSVSSYPNPVSSNVQLTINLLETTGITLKLFDATGKQHKVLIADNLNVGVNTLDLNMEDLPAGMYYYTIETSYGVQSSKLIKI